MAIKVTISHKGRARLVIQKVADPIDDPQCRVEHLGVIRLTAEPFHVRLMLQADLVDQSPRQAAQLIRAVVKPQAQGKRQSNIVRLVLAAAAGVVELFD